MFDGMVALPRFQVLRLRTVPIDRQNLETVLLKRLLLIAVSDEGSRG
jgi:hypothetical protein